MVNAVKATSDVADVPLPVTDFICTDCHASEEASEGFCDGFDASVRCPAAGTAALAGVDAAGAPLEGL